MEDRATGLQVDQRPKIFPGFPFGRDIYSRFQTDLEAATKLVTASFFPQRSATTEIDASDSKNLKIG